MKAAGMRLSASRQKLVGDAVKLRALWWDGPLPTPGDLLETSTGRVYLIDRVGERSQRGSFSLFCIVTGPPAIPIAAAFGHTTFHWTWTRKSTRRPKAFGGRR